jgi:cytochrome c
MNPMGKYINGKRMWILPMLLITVIFAAIACQKKAVPVITDRKAEPPKKVTSVYPPVAGVAADTVKGKVLFMMSCNRCHGLPSLSQFEQKVWEGHLSTMFPRTRLNNEEAFHVRAYVLANAQQ